MLALVEATKPGPFERSTIDLGGYRGWRVDAKLVCMAGERMHPGNWTEISAICTAPEHQGRGLAGSIVSSLVNDIRTGAARPHGRHSRLGLRSHPQVLVTRAPGAVERHRPRSSAPDAGAHR